MPGKGRYRRDENSRYAAIAARLKGNRNNDEIQSMYVDKDTVKGRNNQRYRTMSDMKRKAYNTRYESMTDAERERLHNSPQFKALSASHRIDTTVSGYGDKRHDKRVDAMKGSTSVNEARKAAIARRLKRNNKNRLNSAN